RALGGALGLFSVAALAGDAAGHSTPVAAATATPMLSGSLPEVGVRGTDGALWVNRGNYYEARGGQLLDAPALAVVNGAMAYVVVGTDHQLYIRSDAETWRRLSSSYTYCNANPAITVNGTTFIVACKGGDGALWVSQTGLTGSGLPVVGGFSSLGGRLNAGPAVAVVNNELTFLVTGTDQRVSVRTLTAGYSGTSWFCVGHPAVASNGGQAYFACNGTDGQLWYSQNSGSGWGGTFPAGGRVLGGVGIAAGPSAADIYVEGVDYQGWHTVLPRNGSTSGFNNVGGVIGNTTGTGAAYGATPAPAPPTSGTPGAHVAVIMLENRGYGPTLGTCSSDPYFCSLANSYASMTNWHGVTHPSLPNYLAFDSGSTQGCTTDGCAGGLTGPDLGGQLSGKGIGWVAYMESMPYSCYSGGSYGYYAKKHNPFLFFNDVVNNNCAAHDVPYPGASSMISTLDSASAPSFVWITPNLVNDMHDGTVQQGDAWLQANVDPILHSTWFTSSASSTVMITMDEGDTGTTNQIPMVVISNHAKGYGPVSTGGNHYGALRSIEETYGLSLLGGASNGTSLSYLFG
ncbi:MAG: alkaline phosphatase family protein, partial [Actinobacteria bacterium]|nr:alkaline phosphatase family protein [Actinomycetota bacterium]